MSDQQHHSEPLSTRVKEELPEFLEQQFGHFEQHPPHKPSFLTVVLIACAVMLLIFIVALIVLHLRGSDLGHFFRRQPTSQLFLPAPFSGASTYFG
ncbi:MAG TPA: hypothetical protein VMD97_04570 [Candidatus Aquilonibacter sp.]|nr:hypothetical protein [Candidatus Aquilonibacter sp.]